MCAQLIKEAAKAKKIAFVSVLALSPPSSFTLSREREREFRVYILSNNINNINTYDIQFG